MSNDELATELQRLRLVPAPTPEQLRQASAVERYMVAELQRNSAVTSNMQEHVAGLTKKLDKIGRRHTREDWIFLALAWIATVILAPAVVAWIVHVMHWI